MHRALPHLGWIFSHAVTKQSPSYCLQTALNRFLANTGLTSELQIRRASAAARTEEGTGLQGEADTVTAAAAAGGGDF
jgi:hypothetical protein